MWQNIIYCFSIPHEVKVDKGHGLIAKVSNNFVKTWEFKFASLQYIILVEWSCGEGEWHHLDWCGHTLARSAKGKVGQRVTEGPAVH